jgi:hypothetical protein
MAEPVSVAEEERRYLEGVGRLRGSLASFTSHTPSSNRSAWAAATSVARRALPTRGPLQQRAPG